MDVDSMTVKQISKMSEWLKQHGFSAEEILECIDYIASTTDKKEIPNPPQAND